MQNKHEVDFHELVWAAARRVGSSAPRIADEVMRAAFPRTCMAADDEGAVKIFRSGVKDAVANILRKSMPVAVEQRDFADIDQQFQPMAKALGSKSYFVPSLEEYVGIADLIACPEMLDEARKYMRKKGHECINESKKLDRLYFAVVAATPELLTAE